jgi:periplasmic protein TonB
MTSIEFDRLIRSGGGRHANGWAASLLYHAIGISGVLYFMSGIDKSVLLDTFEWEVSMVEAATTRPPPPSPPSTPAPPQPRQVKRAADPRPPVETLQTVRHVDHEIATPQIQTPVETAQSEETTPVVAQAVTTHAPVVEHGIEQSTVVQKEALDASRDLPAVAHRAVLHRDVQHRRTQADYGWLRDLLWKRIEDLKRYPTLARTNHWEGKVIVQAVIKADGTVGALSVAESSGHALLDEEAMVVMRKASPLRLTHQLEKAQITILVPISYRLEG